MESLVTVLVCYQAASQLRMLHYTDEAQLG